MCRRQSHVIISPFLVPPKGCAFGLGCCMGSWQACGAAARSSLGPVTAMAVHCLNYGWDTGKAKASQEVWGRHGNLGINDSLDRDYMSLEQKPV